jgi:NDP-sugar pyrophosphorylase family protein
LGTRLAAVAGPRPKVLVRVRGRPFIAYVLDALEAAQVERVVLCTGHLAAQVRMMLGARYGGLELCYSTERLPLGTGGALAFARPLLGDDAVLVLNGDSYCAVDLDTLWRWHHAQGAAATLLATHVDDTGRYGRIDADKEGCVLRFAEKAAGGPGWINAGIYVLSRRVIAEIPTGRPVSLEHDVLPGWVGRGLAANCCAAPFIDVGTPEDYAAADAFIEGVRP